MSIQRLNSAFVVFAGIMLFLAAPVYAQSETETFSLGVSGYWTHVRVAGYGLVGDGGGNAAAFGLVSNVNVSDKFGFSAEIRAPYKVSLFVEEDDPTASYGYDAQLLDAHLSVRYRPLGRTEFTPFVDGGLTYVTALSGSLQDQDSDPLNDDSRHKFQPHIGLGLSWNSGWSARDSHFEFLLRSRVPPLELPGGPGNPRANSDAWSWEIGLRARISLF